MILDIEPLRKILELERAKGYKDIAVIGGLDRYLSRLRDEKTIEDAGFLEQVSLDYSSMDREQRSEWVESMLDFLNRRDVRAKPRRETPSDQSLDSPLTTIKGISPSLSLKFERLGVRTVRDLIYFFPRRHLDYSRVKPISRIEVGAEQTVVATVWEAHQTILGGRKGTEAIVGDDSGNMRVVWFNQPYLAKRLRPNLRVVISGRVGIFRGMKVFESPQWEPSSGELVHTGRLVPIYPLTEGLSPRVVRRVVKETVEGWAPRIADFLPEDVRDEARLLGLPQALVQAHYPDGEVMKDMARRRLAFDELFLIQLGVLERKHDWQEGSPAPPLKTDWSILEGFLDSLPFTLTPAQRRALDEILSDLEKPKPMCRLLQGEVGSGKTVVAATALLVAALDGFQGVLMAPTEILAEQHFNSISALLSTHPFNIALLTGGLRRSEKEELHQRIRDGEVDIVIGTHALIQKGAEFERLGLAIVDEQHRFGVMQRSQLRHKGTSPHLLVMTATPIPRSLALTLYGDLELSVIDELPPGRKEIRTRWLESHERGEAYSFLRGQVREGRQGFIICPLIEESERVQTRAAIKEYELLSRDVFPDLRLGLLHGRMKSEEKERVMRRFRDGELDILVSTPVVEVGIDVPNATVMIVEGADHFGFAQLHQFRGRVGRGEHPSYCLLLADNPSAEGRDRLGTIEKTQDGFALAEEDLRLRGPGEFFGTRQSGLPDLKMARFSDVGLLELARSEAIRLFEADPELKKPGHRLLAQEVGRLLRGGAEWS